MILSTAINADGYAVRIGASDANTFSQANIKLRVEHNSHTKAGLSGLDGIRIRGAAYGTFELYTASFGVGIAVRGSTGTENVGFCMFNNCRTYDTNSGFEINNTGGAWFNQNQMNNCTFVGSTNGVLMQGTYPSDNNLWLNTEFEGSACPARIIMGKYNLFEWPRLEACGNFVFGDTTTASACALNRIRMAYPHTSGSQLPQVTHDGFWPNFVEGPDGPIWRPVINVTIDDFTTIGTNSYCPKLREYGGAGTVFSNMVFNTAIGVRSFKFVSQTAFFLPLVAKGDVFRLTIKWANALTSAPVFSTNARNDTDTGNAATLSAGAIPYIGWSDTSSFSNGTSGTAPNFDINADHYIYSRYLSINRSDFNIARMQLRDGVEYQWFRVDRLWTELSRDGDPAMPYPPVKVISSLATGPDYIGQMGIVSTGNLIVFAISHTAWNCLTGTATWDPVSLAQGAQATTTITVTGAAVGNRCEVKFSLSLTATGTLSLTGFVSAANTVTAVLQNNGTAAADLSSGTVTAYVWAG